MKVYAIRSKLTGLWLRRTGRYGLIWSEDTPRFFNGLGPARTASLPRHEKERCEIVEFSLVEGDVFSILKE